MKGYIANTDFDWYEFLSGRSGLDEVNFWKPSGATFRTEPGTPFFFKLKKPFYAIAGFGFFSRYAGSPISLVWDSFGEKNGAPDYETLRKQIEPLRTASRHDPSEDYVIGCIMISRPVFFPRHGWIQQPSDWPKHVPPGMSYDLDRGEGKRIWDACRARVEGLPLSEHAVTWDTPAGRGKAQVVFPRLGQSTFRVAVADAYRYGCAITEEHSLPALEAAHIHRFSEGGNHLIRNGILLRADLHRLFDKGYVTITPDHVFRVSKALEARYGNGRSYYPLDGKPIALPASRADHPDRDLVVRHNREVFRA